MKKLLIPVFFTLFGCANVDAGFTTAQAGLANVDIGVQQWAQEYADSVRFLRQYCAALADTKACEVKYKVDDMSVEQMLLRMQLMSKSYSEAALTIAQMQALWGDMKSELRSVIESSESVRGMQ